MVHVLLRTNWWPGHARGHVVPNEVLRERPAIARSAHCPIPMPDIELAIPQLQLWHRVGQLLEARRVDTLRRPNSRRWAVEYNGTDSRCKDRVRVQRQYSIWVQVAIWDHNLGMLVAGGVKRLSQQLDVREINTPFVPDSYEVELKAELRHAAHESSLVRDIFRCVKVAVWLHLVTWRPL